MGKFIYPGVAKVVFAPSVSNLAAPSSGEISAGTVLTTPGTTGLMKVMKGWTTEPSNADVPDVGTTFIPTIPGMKSSSEASIEFYDDDASTTIRTALAEGTAGYMIIMRYGQTTGKRAEVFPCKVTTLNDIDIEAAANPAMFVATFAITSAPNKSAVCP